MVKNPNKNKTNYGESYINHYAQLGSDFIGLHRRSFDDHNEFENSIKNNKIKRTIYFFRNQ